MRFHLFITLGILLLASSCRKEDRSDTTLKVFLGDNLRSIPFNAKAVNIEIQGVKVKYKGSVEPVGSSNTGSSDDWVWLTTQPAVYNLVALYTGQIKQISFGPVPGASIREMRFVLGKNNSIEVGGQTIPIQLPAGSEYGFKIEAQRELALPFDSITIDFNTAKSIQMVSGKYTLNPAFAIR